MTTVPPLLPPPPEPLKGGKPKPQGRRRMMGSQQAKGYMAAGPTRAQEEALAMEATWEELTGPTRYPH